MPKYIQFGIVFISVCYLSQNSYSGAFYQLKSSQYPSNQHSVSEVTPLMKTRDPNKVYGLPFAGEKGFLDLDSYIAFRKTLIGTDIPHFRQVGPDLFQLEGGRMRQPETFTRKDLEQKFGFRK